MGEGALDAVGEVSDVGPEGDDLAGESGMMEETGGNQRSQRGEDGSEALNEGFHGHVNEHRPVGVESQGKKGGRRGARWWDAEEHPTLRGSC